MHQDSHKIFESYILSKGVNKEQLNEEIKKDETIDEIFGLFQSKEKREEKELEKEQKESLNIYKNSWLRYWYPRFSDKKQIAIDKNKTLIVFQKFLDSQEWADPAIEANKEKAIEYFKTKWGTRPYKNIENNVFEILLYGSASDDPLAGAPVPKKDTKIVSIEDPRYKEISKSEYDKLSPEEKSKGFEKPSDFDKTADQAAAEPEEDTYKLKAEVTRLKKLNQSWINAIKKKFGRTVRKPSDLAGKVAKKSVVGKK